MLGVPSKDDLLGVSDRDTGNGDTKPHSDELTAVLHQVQLAKEGEPVASLASRVRDYCVRDAVPRSIYGLVGSWHEPKPGLTRLRRDLTLNQLADLGSERAVVDEGGGRDASLREEVAQCCGAGLTLDVDQVTLVGEDVTELYDAASTARSFDARVQLQQVLRRSLRQASVVVGFDFTRTCRRKGHVRVW